MKVTPGAPGQPLFFSLEPEPINHMFARDQHAEYFSGIRGLPCFSLSVTDNTQRWAEWLNIRTEGLQKSLCPTAFLVWEFPLHLPWHKKSVKNLPNDWEAFIFHDNSFSFYNKNNSFIEISFTYQKIHFFGVRNSLAFRIVKSCVIITKIWF